MKHYIKALEMKFFWTIQQQHRGTNQICHKAIEKMLRNKSLDKGKSRTHQN